MGQRTERKNRRVRARSVTAHLKAGTLQIVGEVENLSRSGLFVRTDEVLSVGDKVQLDLVRVDGKSVLSLPGLVADTLKADRAASLGRKTGLGIAFDPISDPELKERLDRLLRELIVVSPPTGEHRKVDPVAAPDQDGELQRLRSQVRGLLIDVSDLKRSVAERDALIGQQRKELEILRKAFEETKP